MELETAEIFRIRPEFTRLKKILGEAFKKGEHIKMGESLFVVIGHDSETFVLQAVNMLSPAPWTGDGLPPAGIDVEVVSPGYSDPRFDRFIGQVVTVVAHDVIDGDPVAVFRMPVDGQPDEMDYHALVAKCFRPARTPEQIEEDARQAAVTIIENRIMARMGDLNVRNLAEDLHGLLQEMAVKP